MSPKQNYEALQPLSNEHSEVLAFCSKIRGGLHQKIDITRIKKYSDWFKKAYLDHHFELEKKHVFPILGNNNFRVKRALANHRRLNRLFGETAEPNKVLNKIEEELSSYIRFEERILFNEIRKIASPKQLEEIEKNHHQLLFTDAAWKDRFWVA